MEKFFLPIKGLEGQGAEENFNQWAGSVGLIPNMVCSLVNDIVQCRFPSFASVLHYMRVSTGGS